MKQQLPSSNYLFFMGFISAGIINGIINFADANMPVMVFAGIVLLGATLYIAALHANALDKLRNGK